jgi:hypothetical protein
MFLFNPFTHYPIMAKRKQVFRNVCEYNKKAEITCITIQTLPSLCRAVIKAKGGYIEESQI